MRTSNKLMQAIKASVLELREQLKQINAAYLDLTIHCEGRVHDGEIKISIQLGNYNESAKGYDLSDVAEEFMRRHGWNKRHAPLMLSDMGEERLENEKVVSKKRKAAIKQIQDQQLADTNYNHIPTVETDYTNNDC